MIRLCTICARAGSKGVKNKNTRTLFGKPLIAHSIIQARKSGLFTAIAVSSDADNILQVAGNWGADLLIKRPLELATDQAPKLPAIRHCLLEAEKLSGQTFSVVVDLDTTSPLRTVDDLVAAVRLLEEKKVSNVITGTPARRSPYFNLVETDEKGTVMLAKPPLNPIFRRQDAPKCYDMNASIYVWNRNVLVSNNTLFLKDTLLYVMPPERSVDIDSEIDFELVKLLMEKRRQNYDE